MTDNTIRVRIVSADADTIQLTPVDDIRDCKRCAEGNGCGGHPWFRGLQRQRTIRLPNSADWHSGDTAELHLSLTGLNLSAALTYGLPLVAFIATLALTHDYHEGWQILAATAAALVSPCLTRPLRRRLIARCLQLTRPAHKTDNICRYPPSRQAG